MNKTEINKYSNENFNDYIHKIGRTTVSFTLIIIFLVPTLVCLKYNTFPPLKNFSKGFVQVAMVYIPICIAEFLTFVPMLGSGASYLAFITGNLTNLKIPCASMAVENAGVESNTDEGDVIAMLSVASSSIVTVTIIIIGMIAMVPLKPILSSPVLKPAFDNILPALFGALGAYWFVKQWKLAIVPVIASIIFAVIIIKILNIDIGSIQGALIPVLGIISVLSARVMYKKEKLTKINR